jgi:tetratricopeptide (TPR) repeat protein
VERYHNPQAVRHLKDCLDVWPQDADILLLTARAARRARTYADAEIALEKYQHLRGLDEALSFEQLLLAAERGEDQAVETCRRFIEQGHPNESLILEALARGALSSYHVMDARACLDRWLKVDPDNPQALCFEGQYQSDYPHSLSTALEKFRRAVQLDPEHEEARLGLAVNLIESKLYGEAIEHLEYLRKAQPDNVRVAVGLAQCRDGQGQRAEAIRLVDAVLARQPDHPPALALRGRLALDEGDFGSSEAMLRKAVSGAPSDHQARYNLVLCLYHNGKDVEAKEHENKIRQGEADFKRFREIVGGDLVQRPHDPAAHCELGQLLLRSGNREEGLRWLKSALRLDPQYEPARQALKESYRHASSDHAAPG